MNNSVILCICSPQRLDQYKILHKSIKRFIPSIDSVLYYGGDNIDYLNLGNVEYIKRWVEISPYGDDWYTYTYLRPKAILDLFNKGYDEVILLGADTEFFNIPDVCFDSLKNNDCFVTMYTHEPYEGDELYPNDYQILDVGQINSDFIGFRKNDKTIKFLKWLEKTLNEKIVYKNKILLDQSWFSMCFSFLDKVEIIRHLGYNVANYNMHNRQMHKQNDKWVMKDGTPLVLFHYAGFIKGKEESISKHQNRYKADGELLDFLKDYSRKLNEF